MSTAPSSLTWDPTPVLCTDSGAHFSSSQAISPCPRSAVGCWAKFCQSPALTTWGPTDPGWTCGLVSQPGPSEMPDAKGLGMPLTAPSLSCSLAVGTGTDPPWGLLSVLSPRQLRAPLHPGIRYCVSKIWGGGDDFSCSPKKYSPIRYPVMRCHESERLPPFPPSRKGRLGKLNVLRYKLRSRLIRQM